MQTIFILLYNLKSLEKKLKPLDKTCSKQKLSLGRFLAYLRFRALRITSTACNKRFILEIMMLLNGVKYLEDLSEGFDLWTKVGQFL